MEGAVICLFVPFLECSRLRHMRRLMTSELVFSNTHLSYVLEHDSLRDTQVIPGGLACYTSTGSTIPPNSPKPLRQVWELRILEMPLEETERERVGLQFFITFGGHLRTVIVS